MTTDLYSIIVQIVKDNIAPYLRQTQWPQELIVASFNGLGGSATIANNKNYRGHPVVVIESSLPLLPGMRVLGVPTGGNKYFVVGIINYGA